MHIRDILIPGGSAKLPGDYKRRYLCERCGGTGQQPAGCWDGTAYAAPAGVCDDCHGTGELGEVGSTAKWQGSVLTIKVPGTPLGKPRMTRRDKWAKRACVVRYREWADRVRAIAGAVPPAESVRRLSWVATFECPKSWSIARQEAAHGTLHRSKPDRDNIDKAILDALYPNGDAAIAAGTVEKRWAAEASLVITIELV